MEIKHNILSTKDVQEIAEEFRNKYIGNEDIPVKIESVMQSAMGMHPIPTEGLYKDCGIDGFMSKDFKTVYVDEDYYVSDIHYKRVRFTLAHELGHRILHYDVQSAITFKSEKEWLDFINDMSEKELSWFEWQAKEFAGRLLVPLNQLVKE